MTAASDAIQHELLGTDLPLSVFATDLITALAEKAGTARSYIWAALGGWKSPTLDWIAKVAEALGVDPIELLRPPRTKSRAD